MLTDTDLSGHTRDRATDLDYLDYLVVLNAAIYADTNTPAKLFHDTFQPASGCGVVHVKSNDANMDWQLKMTNMADNRAQWIQEELNNGNPDGWRCGHEARVQSNVLLDVTVCQWGNPVSVTTLIADRMTNSFSA